MNFDVLFFDSAGNVVMLPGGVTFDVERWGVQSRGGGVWCDLVATGDDESLGQLLGYLGFRVLVLDRKTMRPVWWGTVETAATPAGERLLTRSLTGMVNRVSVIYTENNQRFSTAWAEDSESVYLYGKRERLVSLAVGRAAQAEAERTTQLEVLKQPASDVQLGTGRGVARLACIGYWQRLGMVYYGSTEGYERHLTGSATEKIGQSAYAMSGIRFEGNKIYVGSAYHYTDSNDKIQKLGQGAYSAGTIGFEDGVDRIYDIANGFTAFTSGDRITISGSALNDGTYDIDEATASDMYSTTDLDTEGVGASVTITPASYTQVSQQFITAGGDLQTVRVRVSRAGSAGDNLVCTIYADVGGAPGGAALESASIAGSSVPTEKGWVEFTFSGSTTFGAGDSYWKVYTRSGGNSSSSAYVFEVDESTGYADGVMKVWNGSAWVARPTAADMLFEVAYTPAANIAAYVSGDVMVVDGSASNDGTYTLTSVQVDEAPWYLQVDVDLITEPAGLHISLSPRYTKLAQRFQVTDVTGWIINLAKVKVRKVGSSAPTDGLTLQIHADSAGAIGSSLGTATIDAADILASGLGYVTADFGTTLSLTAGTYYWLSVKRTGADSHQTGYVVQVDNDGGYATGKLQGWDGSSWGDRTPTSDLVFELVGVRETTQLISDILTATGLFAGVDLRVSSGVYASPYYDGDGLALGIIERLLLGGTSSGLPLLATVTPERYVRIEAAPTAEQAYGMKGDGTWVDRFDREIPAVMAPAGVWLEQLDLPGTVNVSAFGSALKQFVEAVEFHADRDIVAPRFRQNRNPLSVGLREG